jgi:hypothetical protein
LLLNYSGARLKSPATIAARTAHVQPASAQFAPGAPAIIPNPAIVNVTAGTTGTGVIVAGPRTVAPYTVSTAADRRGDPSCAGFVQVSRVSGDSFTIAASGNAGACWLSTVDGHGHTGELPVLVSAGNWSVEPSPSPTPPASGGVVVTPARVKICPNSGPNACSRDTATVGVAQSGFTGSFTESDDCPAGVATVAAANATSYTVTSAANVGTCTATFTGGSGSQATLTIDVAAPGVTINASSALHQRK